MPTNKAKVLSSQTVYKGSVFSVRRDKLTEPGGIAVARDVIVHAGSVVVLPVFPDGSILMVRQYRHAIGDFLWELVAGRVEPGESIQAGARRELIEEAGYTARKMQKLFEFFPSPGMLSERMHIFLAAGLTQGTAQPEEDEKIEPKRFPLAVIEKSIQNGKIRDGKSLAAILYYARFMRR